MLKRKRVALRNAEIAAAETRAFDTAWRMFGGTTSYASFSQTSVSEQSALGLPAFYSGVSYIASTIASWPMHSHRPNDAPMDNRDNTKVPTPQICIRPSPPDTRSTTLSSLVSCLVMRGNAFALLGKFDRSGHPQVLALIHPDRVYVERNDVTGEVLYRIGTQTFTRAEIMHIKVFAEPEALCGRGVLHVSREALGEQIALQEYAAKFFAESAVPPLTFSSTDTLDEAEAERFLKLWQSNHANNRKPGLMPAGVKVERLSVTPEEAQFISSRRHALTEIELMLNFPVGFLGSPGSHMTYTNLQDTKALVRERALRPYTTAIEEAFTDLVPRGQEVKFNLDAWLRSADTKTRYETHKVGIDAGFLQRSEARALEDLPPIPGINNNQPPPVEEPSSPDKKEPPADGKQY